MESAINHPCQSLADWKTMDEVGVPRNGGKFVLSWAYHPRALPLAVPSATVHMAAMRGMDVTVLRPEGFRAARADHGERRGRPQAPRAARCAKPMTAPRHWRVHTSFTPSSGLNQHYGNMPADDASCAATLADWCVDEPWFDTAHDDCALHALPAGAAGCRGRRPGARRPAQRGHSGSPEPHVRADGCAASNAGTRRSLMHKH